MMLGSRTIVPRAPISDKIPANFTGSADIYSMFRIRQGYTGFCRRVERSSDNATLDVGFTAGGLYDIKKEREWAGSSTVYVIRWYNQTAGIDRPAYLQASTPNAPRSIVSGVPVTFNGHPAIEMSLSGMSPNENGTIVYDAYVSVVWIGLAFFEGDDVGLWTIHEEGFDDARICEVDSTDNALIRDAGIYYDRKATFSHPTDDFSLPSIIVTSNYVSSPYQTTAWVNGSDLTVGYISAPAIGIGVGSAQPFGTNVVHTFIADGQDDLAIHSLAKTFNVRNWIY